MTERQQIVFQRGPYWVMWVKGTVEVFRDREDGQPAKRIARIGGDKRSRMDKAVAVIDRRIAEDEAEAKPTA